MAYLLLCAFASGFVVGVMVTIGGVALLCLAGASEPQPPHHFGDFD